MLDIAKYSPVFVIGSNSFGGSSYVKSLIDAGVDVYGFGRSPEPNPCFLPYSWATGAGKFVFERVDLNKDLDLLMQRINEVKPRIIVNFASQSMVGQSWTEPEHWLQTNVVAQTSLIRGLAKCDFLEKYIHFTTPEVYGSTSGWIGESFDFQPSTPYAVSRAAGDWMVKLWADQFDFPAIFTRAGNIYGEGQQLYRIIPKTILCALTGQKVPLHGGGASIRSFIHMDDVSDGVNKIIDQGKIGETYHISPKDYISIHDLVVKIGEMTGVEPSDLYQMADDRIGKDQYYLLDPERMQKDMSWQCQISLEEGLSRCIDWVRDNLEYLNTVDPNYIHKP